MKPKKAAAKAPEVPAKPAAAPFPWQPYALAGAAIIVLFWAYGPALNGAFVFDDTVQWYAKGLVVGFSFWVNKVRPILMFTYWANSKLASSGATYPYHVVNLLIHMCSVGLMFLIVRRLLEWAGFEKQRRTILACFAAGVFLLHPAMTEAVAYIAGRSESFSTMWALAAFAVFIYRPKPAAGWGTVVAVFFLFALALGSKEQTVALPGLLLLTDFWWNPGFSFKGIRGNWKLYAPMAVGAMGGLYFVRGLIFGGGEGAGFNIGVTPLQYLFTECRALFVYIGELLLPVNLNADWVFPVSRTIFDHGAIIGFVSLLALLVAAFVFRKRFPLAGYGFIAYLILMAPTSSILPIADPVAERRLYFSVIGLLLVLVDLCGRLPLDNRKLATVAGGIVLLCAIATHGRAAVWQDEQSLWTDVVEKQPENARAHFHIGFVSQEQQRWGDAIREYETVARLNPTDIPFRQELLLDWGIVYLATGQPDTALTKFHEALKLGDSAEAWVQVAEAYGQQQKWPDALAAAENAKKANADFSYAYFESGKIHLASHACAEAVQDFAVVLRMAAPGEPSYEQTLTMMPAAQNCAKAR